MLEPLLATVHHHAEEQRKDYCLWSKEDGTKAWDQPDHELAEQ